MEPLSAQSATRIHALNALEFADQIKAYAGDNFLTRDEALRFLEAITADVRGALDADALRKERN